MTIKSIETHVQEIREELGYTRGVPPRIESVYKHEDSSLHIITPDRSEKSLLLGPGGRISAELAKRTSRKITIYGQDEILLRRHRLCLAQKRIDEVFPSCSPEQKEFLSSLRNMISNEISFPEQSSCSGIVPIKNLRIAVAYSGGIDSSAAIFMLNYNGFKPDAITVQLGTEFYTPSEMNKIRKWCDENNIKQILIKPKKKIASVIQATKENRIHPCGKCHEIIHQTVVGFALENQYAILVTGELLPTGRQSILLEDSLLIVHLPAALSLTKHRSEILAEKSGKNSGRKKFGCLLVENANKNGWRNIGPSIFRVLRELEGGVLTTGQGLEYIKTIVKPWIK